MRQRIYAVDITRDPTALAVLNRPLTCDDCSGTGRAHMFQRFSTCNGAGIVIWFSHN